VAKHLRRRIEYPGSRLKNLRETKKCWRTVSKPARVRTGYLPGTVL